MYGFCAGDYLYAAYKADTTRPGWSVAESLGLHTPVLSHKTPLLRFWPATGFTLLPFDDWGAQPPGVGQTDGSDWAYIGTFAANDVTIAYGRMDATEGYDVTEVKIPISLLTYAGTDGQIILSGQYWQYDTGRSFSVPLPPPPPVPMSKLMLGCLAAGMVVAAARKLRPSLTK